MAFFDSWRPCKSDTVVERRVATAAPRDWKWFCPYSPQSLPLVLPSAADASQMVLPLFGSASASPSGSGLAAAADAGPSTSAAAAASSLSKAEARDVLLHAGGPVWGLDWCPASGGGGSGGEGPAASVRGCNYLAVSCHPLGAQHNVIGALVQAPACIQVWEVSHPEQEAAPQPPQQRQQQQQQQQQAQPPPQQPQQPQRPAGPQLPRLALALAHGGGLCWHCQWCPDPGLADSPTDGGGDVLPRQAAGCAAVLGLVAAALGDGSVKVWPVPHPQAVQQLRPAATPAPAADPLVVSLPPVAACSSAALGGSLPCVVEWLPAPPHDLLAVGCWDGSLALFKLTPGQPRPQQNGGLQPQQQQQQHQHQQVDSGSSGGGRGSSGGGGMHGLELLSHFSADALPLRAVRWVPAAACGGTIDMLHRHILLTAGHEGCLRVWDLRDPFQPLYSHTLSSNSTILSGAPGLPLTPPPLPAPPRPQLPAVRRPWTCDWTSHPFGILVAMEDASLRGIVLDSNAIARSVDFEKKAMFSISWRGPNMGAVWSVAVVAYGGEDGEVGVFPAEYEANSRRRVPHTAVAAVRLEGGALVVKLQRELVQEHGLFSGKVVERMPNLKGARLPDEQEAVHRVAWSRHAGGAGAWLASGGAAGLVRIQWIQSKAPPPLQALTFRVQPSSLTSTATSFSSGEAPSFPWPQPSMAQTQAHQQPQGVWASLFATTAESAPVEAALPPEMDRLMRFTDGPGAVEQEAEGMPLLARLWRYQGP
ncbi:hypothetical protein CHLNCDRAFT_136985 [Chlorella variabilis]|uniref:Uncharacterized protein n=1 Tax=Chlorella variabilis TaxID=554065 RepID=E1ZLR1_CHLVA|nr:hypothetical protein CHLNCDRAFT_136985 [Chlorella variabilis]EFN53310.1 hypothetical protein CHLNCDRAFT_136985 [Chlorella variabilis]|eukprot:XP_005845412.1 hypothetical protein CHLNCDRAFT_136985 [Chlorella variabilis]